jgi:predicted nucleotidyltransferase
MSSPIAYQATCYHDQWYAENIWWTESISTTCTPPTLEPTFTDIGAGLPGVYHGVATWGDFDEDGDLDVLVAGDTQSASGYITRVYRNDGSGTFVDIEASLPQVSYCSAAWGDCDNDQDLDILLTGYTQAGAFVAGVYRNDGDGAFADLNAGLPGVYGGAVALGDYDNDGDFDVLMNGQAASGYLSRVYRNEGGGVFTDVHAGLPGLFIGSVAWGDYDNDGDLDILLTGSPDGVTGISRVYRNDGGGVFVDASAGLPGARGGSATWGDYDSDGDLDILLTGSPDGVTGIARIYRNDGGGVFVDIGAGLVGAQWSSAAWGDFDNDGDLDVLLTGWAQELVPPWIGRVYRNDGAGLFTDINAGLAGIHLGSVAWGDYDNDGDLDVLVTGSAGFSGTASVLYRVNGPNPDTVPGAPGGLTANVIGDQVTLSWGGSGDYQTPANGLSYNLRIGTTPGGSEICSAMADASTGHRQVVGPGNAQQRTSWALRQQSWSTIYWSVQAVDGAFAGSSFAPEQALVGVTPVPGEATRVCTAPGHQTSVRLASDRADGAIVTWQDERNGNSDIYAHHILAEGVVDPTWPADGRALCTAEGAQTGPQVVPDGAGGAIVAWQDDRAGNSDIYAQHVLASGAVDPAWPADGRAVCSVAGGQTGFTICSDEASGAVIAWYENRGVYAQHLLATGVTDPDWSADGQPVSASACDQGGPSTVSDHQGGAIIVFCNSAWPPENSAVHAKHLLPSGAEDPVWPADGVGFGNGVDPDSTLAVSDGAGGAIVFLHHPSGISGCGVRADRVLISGTIAWSMGVGNSHPIHACTHGLTADADGVGGAAVAFVDFWTAAVPPYAYDLVVTTCPVFHRLALTSGQHFTPAITTDGDGGAIVTWLNGIGALYVHHMLASGDLDPECPPDGKILSEAAASGARLARDGSGGAHVVWQQNRGANGWDILAARLQGPTPTSTQAALVSAEATAEEVRLVWSCTDAATIYRRTEQTSWEALGRASPNGERHLTYIDADVTSGTRYGYRLGIIGGGAEVFAGETWVNVPAPELALEGTRPSPAIRGLTVAFSLRDASPARLEVLDIAGRRVIAREVGGLGPGSHVVNLGERRTVVAGIYWLRLTQSGRSLTKRAILIR